MHYHLFQADYWVVTHGRAFIALFDFRASSKTPEAIEALEVDGADQLGIYIPPGVAHGFYALTDTTLMYMVDQYFDGTDELGIYYEDPGLNVGWPDGERIVSERDATCPMMAEIEEDNLPF
jgi:dTDP-4-dehydrorhamnose 3,5-epimerase